MIIKEEKDVKTKVITKVICDICKQQIDALDGEVLGNVKRIFFSYSWPSAIADGMTAELDVCDNCFMKTYYPLIPKEQKRNAMVIGEALASDGEAAASSGGDLDDNNTTKPSEQAAGQTAGQPAAESKPSN